MLRGALITFSVIKVIKIKSNMLQEVSYERPDASEFVLFITSKKRTLRIWLLSHPIPYVSCYFVAQMYYI